MKKKSTIRIKRVKALRQLKLKGLQLNAINPSNLYLIELDAPVEAFSSQAARISRVFEEAGITTIIFPKNYISLYKLEK